jgi:hypothetical protein
VSQPDRHGDDQKGTAVKDRLADVVAARIAFLERSTTLRTRRPIARAAKPAKTGNNNATTTRGSGLNGRTVIAASSYRRLRTVIESIARRWVRLAAYDEAAALRLKEIESPKRIVRR